MLAQAYQNQTAFQRLKGPVFLGSRVFPALINFKVLSKPSTTFLIESLHLPVGLIRQESSRKIRILKIFYRLTFKLKVEEHILSLKIFQTQAFTPSFHIPPYHDIFSVNLGSAELIGFDAACSRDRLMDFNGEKYVCSHGVLWAMPAQKADPMGDFVLPTFMGHGWTIL